jgi:hypothetical protein
LKNTFPPSIDNKNIEKKFTTIEKSHGRIEKRTIKIADFPAEYLEWNGVSQVFEIERERYIKGALSIEKVYSITSLSSELAPAERLLHYVRKHWSIENRLHNIRDGTFDEDHCRVRNHRKAQILAATRSAASAMLRHAGFENITEGREWYSEDRRRTLYLLLGRTE